MAADLSRMRLNPLLDYAGVELKQGAVLLDADANELVAILDRRLRALASDTLGRATVSANTPEAFKVTAVAGALQIGRGRMYVDGMLAENHGVAGSNAGAEARFDDLLAETFFDGPIALAEQPYLPAPAALPSSGVHLVYLDVWDRELTHLEQPALIESAIGVETSSRRQTAWQVRVLAEAAGNGSCASPDAEIPGWSSLIAPSTGVLSTGTFDVAAVADPCELPPTGGYQGLENQLYRVEIHDGGAPGNATFKWSRENASVGSAVSRIVSATALELQSLGRDDVLRISSGDWVEITDDLSELSQRPGEIRRVTVDDATRRLELAAPLPAEMLPSAFPDASMPMQRHLRVRRWDQKGRILRTAANGNTAPVQDLDAAGSSGLITVPASANTELLLENGVTVRFDSSGAKGFRSGDFWCFAARTADGSVEALDRAPPRGIHHHYARLGFWDVAAGTVSDCRQHWPPASGGSDCACTACVTPETHASGQLTIQAAIDRVRDTGGTVCLHAGQYTLAEPVRIANARSVRVQGQGPATVLVAPGSAFVVERSAAIALEDMTLLSIGQASVVSVRSAIGLLLRRLVILVPALRDTRGAAISLAGVVAGATIEDNFIIAPDGIRAGEPTAEDAPGFLITALLRITDNLLWCQRNGIVLSGRSAHLLDSRIAGNQLLGGRIQGIALTGFALPGAAMRLQDNSLSVNGPGIRCALDGSWIERNKLHAARQGDREPTGAGIHLAVGLDASGSDQCQVIGNQLRGFPDAGVLVQAPAKELLIDQNIIEACGSGILMIDGARSGSLTITGNHLRSIGSGSADGADGGAQPDSAIGPVVAGIGVLRTQAATIAGNTVRQVGTELARAKQLVAGIFGMSVQRIRIHGNEVTEIGPPTEFGGTAAGIMLRAPYAQVAIANNHVERDPQPSEQPNAASWYALLLDEPSARERVLSRMANFSAIKLDEARTLVVAGNRAWVDVGATAVDAAGAAVVRGAGVTVLGNTLIARGRTPAVDVSAGGDLMFSDNRCELRANTNIEAVRLASPVSLVHGNRVRGGKPSIAIGPQNATVAAIGNVTTSGVAGPVKPEMQALNLVA
ncbi:Right handed beta helix region family protein [Burkholderiales bacterium 8X]|nr:Right handed beta helix region family protein [Burkholderiales bacterium 8X]